MEIVIIILTSLVVIYASYAIILTVSIEKRKHALSNEFRRLERSMDETQAIFNKHLGRK